MVQQLVEGDAELEADRLPGPLRQQPVGGQQPQQRFLQRVVAALRDAAVILGPGRPGQGIQHRLDRGGAPGGQVPIEAAGTFERGRQPQPAVLEPVRVTVGLGVRAEQLPRNPGQVTQRGAGSGGAEQLAVRLVADSGGEPVGPVRDLPAPRRRDSARGQRSREESMCLEAVHPGDLRARGRAGGLGLPGQPRPRRPVPVTGQPPARHAERRQHPRMRRRLPRLRHRQHAQAIGLQALRPGGGIGTGQELQCPGEIRQCLRRIRRPHTPGNGSSVRGQQATAVCDSRDGRLRDSPERRGCRRRRSVS